MPYPVPAADDAGRPCPPPAPCPTHLLLLTPPGDLVPFAQAAAGLAHTPFPLSEAALRRAFKSSGRYRTWPAVGRAGRLVSMSDVFAVQRDRARAERAAAA